MGHLPTYGAMLVLLVYGSDPYVRPTVSLLLPPLPRRRTDVARRRRDREAWAAKGPSG